MPAALVMLGCGAVSGEAVVGYRRVQLESTLERRRWVATGQAVQTERPHFPGQPRFTFMHT